MDCSTVLFNISMSFVNPGYPCQLLASQGVTSVQFHVDIFLSKNYISLKLPQGYLSTLHLFFELGLNKQSISPSVCVPHLTILNYYKVEPTISSQQGIKYTLCIL